MGDVLEVAKQIQIGKIYVSPGSLTIPDFVATLRKINIPVHVVNPGDRLPIFDSYCRSSISQWNRRWRQYDSIVL